MTMYLFSEKKQKAGMIVLTILGDGVGWHFLYEGLLKLVNVLNIALNAVRTTQRQRLWCA